MPLVGMIMISHSIFPAWDSVPASLSKAVMTDLLRGALGYNGLIVSDDMNMKALAQDEKAWQEAIVGAIAHGADLVLVCEHLDRCRLALEAMMREMGRSPAFQKRVEESATRTWEFRRLLRFN